jgi:uncharacterized protein (TIGR00266 family)
MAELNRQAGPIQFEIIHAGESPAVKVTLPHGQSIYADGGAMVSMTPTIKVEGSLKGGLLGALSRKLLRGETFFFQTLTADTGDGEVLIAPAPTGDILLLEMDGSVDYYVQKGSFLGASHALKMDTKMQNLTQGLFSGEGFFISRIAGQGTLALNSFGAIHRTDLAAGQEYIVDNRHLVAWTSTTSYKIEKASSRGWISSITSGEGLVCRFKGPGTVYLQTRNPSAFGSWMGSYIPRQS